METQANIYKNYAELWNFNLNKIEEIHKELDVALQELDLRYAHFEPMYQKIMQLIEVLSAVYAHYNVLEGKEYVRKLKAVINTYKKYYTREGIDFNLLNYLSAKISALRDHSFADFPALLYDYNAESIPPQEPQVYKNRPFKWITFERNGSDFIVAYQTITIWNKEHLGAISIADNSYTIDINHDRYTVKDLMPKPNSTGNKPNFLIVIDAHKTFIADKICRKIYAENNCMSGKIAPFKKQIKTELSPGRVRVFGKNHIFLN